MKTEKEFKAETERLRQVAYDALYNERERLYQKYANTPETCDLLELEARIQGLAYIRDELEIALKARQMKP